MNSSGELDCIWPCFDCFLSSSLSSGLTIIVLSWTRIHIKPRGDEFQRKGWTVFGFVLIAFSSFNRHRLNCWLHSLVWRWKWLKIHFGFLVGILPCTKRGVTATQRELHGIGLGHHLKGPRFKWIGCGMEVCLMVFLFCCSLSANFRYFGIGVIGVELIWFQWSFGPQRTPCTYGWRRCQLASLSFRPGRQGCRSADGILSSKTKRQGCRDELTPLLEVFRLQRPDPSLFTLRL